MSPKVANFILNLTNNLSVMQLIKSVSCLLAGALALTFVSCEKEDKTISIEKIAFNETSLTISVGQTLTPELTITPEDATDRTYTLTSSDEAVVAVSGLEIKAVAAGDAVITATAQGGTLTSECSVTVVPEGFPTEFTAFNSAKGFFYGDYYMSGTDNYWTYFTTGSVVFADGAFSGKGTALFLELNAPKSGNKSVTAGSYTVDESGEMHEYTFVKGEDFGAEGLQGTFVYDSEVDGNYLVVSEGMVSVKAVNGEYVVTAYVKAGDKTYSFTYSGSIPLEDYSKDYENYKVVEMKNLSHGTLDYYGTKIYGKTGTDYSGWTIYLGDKTMDFENYDGTGEMLMLDLNTAASYTTAIPSGTYKVMYAADNAHFQPFTVVPGFTEGSAVLGTWYALDWEPVYAANIGWVKVTNENDKVYTIDFKFRDDNNETFFQGAYKGELTYGDYSE